MADKHEQDEKKQGQPSVRSSFTLAVHGGTHINIAQGEEVHQTNTVNGVDVVTLQNLIDAFQETLKQLPKSDMIQFQPRLDEIRSEAKAGSFDKVKRLMLALLASLSITADTLQVQNSWPTINQAGQAVVHFLEEK